MRFKIAKIKLATFQGRGELILIPFTILTVNNLRKSLRPKNTQKSLSKIREPFKKMKTHREEIKVRKYILNLFINKVTH